MPVTKRGSQTREPYDEAGYRIVGTWPDLMIGEVILEDENGKRELWALSPTFAGYVITINDRGYEFVRSLGV